MTIVYTAHWTTNWSDPVSAVTAAITAECDALRAAQHAQVITAAHTTLTESAGALDLRAGVNTLTEGGLRRSTTVVVTAVAGQRHHVRVTVEHLDPAGAGTGDDVVAAPRVVHRLLAAAPDAVLGELRVTPTPRTLTGAGPAEALAEVITDFDRELPIVVLAQDPDRAHRAAGSGTTRSTAPLAAIGIAATGLAGAARVVAVDVACAGALTEAIGPTFGLPTGTGLRVFLPDVELTIDEDSTRHLHLGSDRVYTDPRGAVRTAARAVLAHTAPTSPTTTHLSAAA